ncbi:MAG: glycosyltransferase family 2 protein [Gammaproteobacteria bacterium]|nr:MAG: glycosyltransferase family 2 protein [Gammaproteobacteria bacterium]RKZ43478.1 MAG: glycosyltransferase family 2 protein [Gammaproteobacteria bacterium]RKZ76107.1 MAG: glycosyltransferase family 2 protein [Gammaproteobacteria bacterium]
MNKPPLSVVIIGRNEGQRLVDCIRSVQNMNDPPSGMEIIYVDSDSTDGSVDRAKALGTKVLVVHPERPAAAIGRNAGWRAAKAPLILFLDGDTILHPDFVKEATQSLDNSPKVAIVWGHRRELYPNASWYQRILDLDWIYPPGHSDFCGGDALIHHHILEQVGGYNPQLIAGEEPEMCQRIRTRGYSILHIDKPMTLHDLAINHWSQYWQRAIRGGHAYAEISSQLRDTKTPLWQHESRKNGLHASILIGIFIVGLIISLGLKSLWPFFGSILLFLLLSLRSAWRARWKSKNLVTLFLYGLHSQFQHIPIAVGQWSYYYHRWRGQRRRLIEYK